MPSTLLAPPLHAPLHSPLQTAHVCPHLHHLLLHSRRAQVQRLGGSTDTTDAVSLMWLHLMALLLLLALLLVVAVDEAVAAGGVACYARGGSGR